MHNPQNPEKYGFRAGDSRQILVGLAPCLKVIKMETGALWNSNQVKRRTEIWSWRGENKSAHTNFATFFDTARYVT